MALSRNFCITRSTIFDTDDNSVVGLWLTGKLWSFPAFRILTLILVFQAIGKYSSRWKPFRMLDKNTIPLGGKFFKVELDILSWREQHDLDIVL